MISKGSFKHARIRKTQNPRQNSRPLQQCDANHKTFSLDGNLFIFIILNIHINYFLAWDHLGDMFAKFTQCFHVGNMSKFATGVFLPICFAGPDPIKKHIRRQQHRFPETAKSEKGTLTFTNKSIPKMHVEKTSVGDFTYSANVFFLPGHVELLVATPGH